MFFSLFSLFLENDLKYPDDHEDDGDDVDDDEFPEITITGPIHTIHNNFLCPKCYREFGSENSCRYHYRYECNTPKQFQCTYCDFCTKRKGNLKNHVNSKHLRPKNFQPKYTCPKCNRSYLHKNTMVHHLKYECGLEAKFHCHLCTRRYRQKSSLKEHVKNAHQ